MQFDDRLATVLRHRATGVRAARTQFRQLLDLLDRRHEAGTSRALAAAWLRLGALGGVIPEAERAAIVRDPSIRFRNPELVVHLAEDEPSIAAAAVAKADLSEDDWDALIPRLPIRARGFLRLRRNLPRRTRELLDRLGVHDRGLPLPSVEHAPMDNDIEGDAVDVEALAPARVIPIVRAEPVEPPVAEDSEIGVLVKRIERFRQARSAGNGGGQAPRLPLEEETTEPVRAAIAQFSFTADIDGRIEWADAELAPALVGMRLSETCGPIAQAIRLRQPLDRMNVHLDGAPTIAGAWIVDASPRFTIPDGRFNGYAGRMRRAPERVETVADRTSDESNRIRQLLHELRTPVNAIQGFAEVIQQQLFGPTPHEYRALAASIAGDSARILAGFDELDRLARLETGALEPEPGETDLPESLARIAQQLEPTLTSRLAKFELAISDGDCRIPLSSSETDALLWRLLATVAGAAGTGEEIDLSLRSTPTEALLTCDLPSGLVSEADIFAATAKAPSGAIRAGAFGAGFSLRLARAEASAIGGSLIRVDDTIQLVLPLLTPQEAQPSPAQSNDGVADAS